MACDDEMKGIRDTEDLKEATAAGDISSFIVPVPISPTVVVTILFCSLGVICLTALAYGFVAWGIGFPVEKLEEIRRVDGTLLMTVPTKTMVRHSWGLLLVLIAPLTFIALRKYWFVSIERGRAWGVVTGFIFAALLVTFLIAAILMAVMWSFMTELTAAFLSWSIAIVIVVFIGIRILRSYEVRQWIRLNGRCPHCHSWDFGIVSPPVTAICVNCKAKLEFRNVKFRQQCPQCKTKVKATWRMVGDIGVCPKCQTEFRIREMQEGHS
jgi:hypothetical protein